MEMDAEFVVRDVPAEAVPHTPVGEFERVQSLAKVFVEVIESAPRPPVRRLVQIAIFSKRVQRVADGNPLGVT